MTETKQQNERDAALHRELGRTILDDLHETDFRRTLRQDMQDLYEYYLDQPTRDRLAKMGRVNRWLHMLGWMLKSGIMRLSPLRRSLFIVSILLFVVGVGGDTFWLGVGFVAMTFILLLELKDKLLAQDELLAGQAVQFALMPDENPMLPGWETWLFTRPALEVGGDLVDYLRVADDQLNLTLGDVSGKGLGAALLMAKLQSTLRAIAPRAESLTSLGMELNMILRRDGLPGHFISLIYLELVPGEGRVRLINAGHMPPVVIGRDGLSELGKGGPAVGLMSALPVIEQTTELDMGDLMVIYSDGLTEARNEEGAFFGKKRFLQALGALKGMSAEDAGHQLLNVYKEFVQQATVSDDLSIIVLRRLSEEEE